MRHIGIELVWSKGSEGEWEFATTAGAYNVQLLRQKGDLIKVNDKFVRVGSL